MKRLYRSRENRVLAGVLGGFGEYFSIDPVIFRLVYILIIILTAIVPGILLYIIAALIIPEAPIVTAVQTDDAKEA